MKTTPREGYVLIISELSERLKYNDNGSLVWVSLPKRVDRLGLIAGSKSPSDGYIYIKYKTIRFPAHRIVFYMHNSFIPECIDHINRVRHDNRIENLRSCKPFENSRNQKKQSSTSSRYKGVCWCVERGKWSAVAKMNKKTFNLGRYEKEEDAAIAYNNFAIENFGEFANINIIGEQS